MSMIPARLLFRVRTQNPALHIDVIGKMRPIQDVRLVDGVVHITTDSGLMTKHPGTPIRVAAKP